MSANGIPPEKKQPDLLVILLDCVRASSFSRTGETSRPVPFLDTLAEESSIFTHASTVAPWTLPSHASLFTGTYPWDHGVMGEGRLRFDESIPNVAGLLREAGYSTLALSANGIITPLLSAHGSFESYRCAEWWEKTFRWIEPESLGGSPDDRPRGGRTGLSVLTKGFTSAGRQRATHRTFLRTHEPAPSIEEAVRNARPEEVPLGRRADTVVWSAIDGANRLARVLRAPGDPKPLPLAPWIEPALDGWVRDQPPENPVFAFVNLLDAHEKYLSDASLVHGLRAWRRFVKIPQNARLWLEGMWRPTEQETDLLRRLYESTIVGLEHRVASLVRAFQRAGRWENTLLILTSDHGQAFGEHGEWFHERSPYETLLHVPLWIRWPHGQRRVQIRPEHVGLIDLAPTLLWAAGLAPPAGMSGVPLQDAPLSPRRQPVLAMADGYPSIERHRTSANGPLLERLRKSFAVAYSGNFKAIVGVADGSVQTFDIVQDPKERSDLGGGTDGERGMAVRGAMDAAEKIRQVAKGVVDSGVQDRLRSWGYL